jgi:hypothetical protein|uniref:hypothetical protein n=1 Tax=Altererythrobacter segetis TaxID=1104773 RepID=UPI0014079F8E|nr:hypothetical protein [Altererythrobacter segetis]
MRGVFNVSRVLAGAVALAMVAPALAQGGPPAAAAKPDVSKPMANAPRATEYAALAKLPDLTGLWYPDWAALFGSRGVPPQLTPAAKAKLDAYNAKYKESGPPLYAQAHCLPPGMPGIMNQPFPIDISYQPGRVTIYAEAYEQARWIYTDGRPLPADPDPFFNGTSVGHWEGSTLVVETVGFSPETFIAPGLEHSDKMKIVERIYLVNPKLLIDELTVTDPEVLAAPYVTRTPYKPDTAELREYVCAENNRLTSDDATGANIDLKLDGEDDPFGPPPADKGK